MAMAGSSRSIIRLATMATARTEVKPLANHSERQPPPHAVRLETRTADRAIPVPTPAKWTAARFGLPAALRRSSTSAEAKTSPKALATPPAKRRARKIIVDEARAIAAVVRELTVKASRSQRRREPGRMGVAASSAPAR